MKQVNTQVAKTVLVTGGARRIGAAIVKRFHSAGFRVVVHCHESLNDARELAEQLNAQRVNSAFVVQKNLIHEKAIQELMDETLQFTGRLDVLVNNASIFLRSTLSLSDAKTWDELFLMNSKVPYLLSLAAAGALKKERGVIINITDIHAEKPLKEYAVYCQSKAALAMQTQALAIEFAPDIRVNAVAPGAISWPEGDNALSIETQQKIIGKTPLKCHGEPKWIANAVLTLAENSFITGQILKVDGGRSII